MREASCGHAPLGDDENAVRVSAGPALFSPPKPKRKMRITMVAYGAESLGFQYLSAYLRRSGHDVHLVFDPNLFDEKLLLNNPRLHRFFSFRKAVVQEIIDSKPDIVALSVLTDFWQWARDLANQIRPLVGKPIVVGGVHPTFVAERCIQEPGIDAVCRGEGEQALVEFVNRLSHGDWPTDIQNFWTKLPNGEVVKNPMRPLTDDLDSIPFPDRSIFSGRIRTQDGYMCVSSRGCLYTCSFCFHNSMRKQYKGNGRYLRRRSPENFIEEIVQARKAWGFNYVRMYDEIFTYDVKWLEKFAPLYRDRVNLPFFCLGHPHFIEEDAVRLLKEAGCCLIQIGLQSFDPETRRELLQRYEKQDEVIGMIDRLERHRLPYLIDMIFGLPGDTEESYRRAAEFFTGCRSARRISINLLSYIPTTDMVQSGLDHGLIREKDVDGIADGREKSFTTGGSLRDRKMRQLAQNYGIMYRLAVMLPRWLGRFLIRARVFKSFRFFEPFLGHAIRWVQRSQTDNIYANTYFLYLGRWVGMKARDLVGSRPPPGPIRRDPARLTDTRQPLPSSEETGLAV